MLTTFLIVGFVTGSALGQIFRVFILVPTSVVAGVLVFAAATQQGDAPLHALFQAAATLAMLQGGYMISLVPWIMPVRGAHGQAQHSGVARRR